MTKLSWWDPPLEWRLFLGDSGAFLIYIYRSRYNDLLRAGRAGIESRCGRDFPCPSRPALGLTQPPIQLVQGLFHGGKAAETWR